MREAREPGPLSVGVPLAAGFGDLLCFVAEASCMASASCCPRSWAVSVAAWTASCATDLPRSSASCPASLALSVTWSEISPSFSFSIVVFGSSVPTTKPTAAPTSARPSGFSFERPTLAAPSLTCCAVRDDAADPRDERVGLADDRVLAAADRADERVLLLGDGFFHPALDVGLVADRLDGVAHAGAGLLYLFADVVGCFAHCTSSFTVSIVCRGAGEPTSSTFSLPRA